MRRLTAFLIVLIWTLSASAQRAFKGGISVGPVATQMSGDGLAGWDKVGFTAGAWVTMPLSEKMNLDVSLNYITRGSRTKRDTLNFNTFAYHLNYIEVPALLSYDVYQGNSRISVVLGPYIGVLLKQKIVSNGYDYPIDPPFLSYEIGGKVGVKWWLGEGAYIAFYGGSSILPVRNAPSVTNKTRYYEYGNYNQSLEFVLGIRFGRSSS